MATTTALTASVTSLPRGARVTLVAELRIPDRDAYGRLGGAAEPPDRHPPQAPGRRHGDRMDRVHHARTGDSPGTYLLSVSPSLSYDFQAVFTAPGSEGLESSTSPIVTVRVTDACTTTCVNGTEDPMV